MPAPYSQRLQQRATRSGIYVPQSDGHAAFVPKPLPPDPPLRLDDGLLQRLSAADVALGRLDGVVRVIPDPDLFVGMYVRREAVLSSQIEGTQSTLQDLLEVELSPSARRPRSDVGEVVNYVAAMNHGLQLLSDLPISLRFIREIHGTLLRNGRGANAAAGEFRRIPNWIGPSGAGPAQASFVPPPVPEMHRALADLESFLHAEARPTTLVLAALVHAQFETIHPFLDGNGRVGRLLITLLLVRDGVLRAPLLYLSHFLKANRLEYYDRLTAIRQDGDWEGWLDFFLRGVELTAGEAAATAERIFELRENHRAQVMEALGASGLRVLAELLRRPIIDVNTLAREVGVTFATANRLVGRFEDLGLLREVTGGRRGRVFRYDAYLALFDDPRPVE